MSHKMFALLFFVTLLCYAKPPRITLLVILDQLSDEMFQKQAPYYTGMFKTLREKGVMFTNCYHPHAKPKTAVGHATCATGARACEHGIIDNSWIDDDGNTVICDAAPSEAAVLHPYNTNTYTFGKSPHHLWLDTVFDQYALHARDITSIVISGKSRASIMFAGRHGHAIWLDHTTGGFTSSRAYYNHLPEWLDTFNRKNKLSSNTSFTWTPIFQQHHPAYTSTIPAYPGNPDQPQFNMPYHISAKNDAPFRSHLAAPTGQNRSIACVRAGLEHYLTYQPDTYIVMCVSLSSLDYVGHYHGPESKEYRDIMYHADRDLADLYAWLTQQVPAENVLTIFTSDHGSMPIPEQMAKSGMEFAQRIPEKQFLNDLNTAIEQKFGINTYITNHSQPWLYIDQDKHRQLSHETQEQLATFITQYLRRKPYIIDAFTQKELQQRHTPYEQSPYRLLQNQITPERSGEFIYLIRPYCNITTYETGTTHATPYAYDTHVPLIVYQPGTYEHAAIAEHVSTQQLAPTLADTYHVPRPSGAYMPALPIPDEKQHDMFRHSKYYCCVK